MTYIINPFEGLSDVKFGMTSKQVKKFMGTPASIEIDNVMEETNEHTAGMIFRYVDKRLVDIQISRHIDVQIFGIEVFKEENVGELLKQKSPKHIEIKEYQNFVDIGMLTCGFTPKKTKKEKFVTIYSKDRIAFYESFMEVFI